MRPPAMRSPGQRFFFRTRRSPELETYSRPSYTYPPRPAACVPVLCCVRARICIACGSRASASYKVGGVYPLPKMEGRSCASLLRRRVPCSGKFAFEY
eukprot:2792661-Prymnesium_polylepis.1